MNGVPKGEYTIETDIVTKWYKDGKLHMGNIDKETGLTLPAQIYFDGTKYWSKEESYLYRNDIAPDTGLTLPSVIWGDGSIFWIRNGEHHRDDIDPETGLILPSKIWKDKEKDWCGCNYCKEQIYINEDESYEDESDEEESDDEIILV